MITFWAVTVMALLLIKSRSYARALKARQITRELKAQAAKHGLDLDATLVRHSWALGIDKEKARLLYVHSKPRELKASVWDLEQIDNCDILKTYSAPRIYFARRKKRKKYIDRILLHIQHKGQNGDHHIAFYNQADDKLTEMKMLFEKARHWQRMITR